jgi:hypothetical protein
MAGRAAWELAQLREACDRSVDRLFAAAPDLIAVVGDAARTFQPASSAIGSFAGYGVPIAVRLDGLATTGSASADALPLSLTVGAWLLRDRAVAPPRLGQAVASTATAAECAALGASLCDREARVALLVMGDGSARHGEKSPGYADPRADAFDAAVNGALAAADVDALLGLDVAVAAELMVAGRAPWQVMAGAVAATGGRWRGAVSYADAPYGVGYTVATWAPA